MANIILTDTCNATCSFCFAPPSTDRPVEYLNLHALKERIHFVKASGKTFVRLIGGEPTLHPQFSQVVDLILSSGMELHLFTNGFISPRKLNSLLNGSNDKVALLINVNAQARSPQLEVWRNRVLEVLNERISLGFTIISPFFDLTPLFQWVECFNLQKKIRLGFAQPIFGGDNRYLSPFLYKKTAPSILENARIAHEKGITLSFDCGFVPCMFSSAERDQLSSYEIVAESHCAPNLDIGINGEIFHCFSLPQISTTMGHHQTTSEAYQCLDHLREKFRQFGIYPKCSQCEAKLQGACSGGCLSLTLRRFNNLDKDTLATFTD